MLTTVAILVALVVCGCSSSVDYDQEITILGGERGYSGDGIMAYYAEINWPEEVVADKFGNIYIADLYNSVIRFVNKSTGIITTLAGNGTGGYNGDNVPIGDALLNFPSSIILDHDENVIFVDSKNSLVRKIDFATGLITNIVGNGMDYDGFGPLEDDVIATEYPLPAPEQVRMNSKGDLYISCGGDCIRLVDASTGLISTYAGRFAYPGYKTDCLAKDAWINGIQGIWFDKDDNLYLAESWKGIRRFDAETTYNTCILDGDSTNVRGCEDVCDDGPNGDGGNWEDACLCNPYSGWADDTNWYILEYDGKRIRQISWQTGIINTIAGYNLPREESDALAGNATKTDIGFVTFMTGGGGSGELVSLAHWDNQVRLFWPTDKQV